MTAFSSAERGNSFGRGGSESDSGDPNHRHSFNNIGQIFARRAEQEPERVGYRFLQDTRDRDLNLTYAELHRRALRVGGWLLGEGVQGHPVLLVFPPGIDFLVALLGTFYAGAIAVPLSAPRTTETQPHLEKVLKDTRATIVLTADVMLSRLAKLMQRFGCGPSFRLQTVGELIQTSAPTSRSLAAPEHAGLAVLQYTSGSTSAPKGVQVSHSNLLSNLATIADAANATRDSIGVSWLPHYHDMGLVGGILLPAYCGFPVTLMSPASFLSRPAVWLQTISRLRATISVAPNFAYDLSARKIDGDALAEIDLSSWNVAFCGSEPIQKDTLERFAAKFGRCGFRPEAFFPCYGLAEATLMVTGGPANRGIVALQLASDALKKGNIAEARASGDTVHEIVASGALLSGTRVEIVDPDSRARCERDRIGEIWVTGPSVASGYWNKAEESSATFSAYISNARDGPFLRTGDLGFVHDGALYVTGRWRDLIIVRGLNYYPQDIEQTAEHAAPNLRSGAGAAFSVDVGACSQVVLVYETERSTGDEFEPVFLSIRRSIAAEHGLAIHAIVLIQRGTLPKTTSGKVRRNSCRAAYLEGTLKELASWRADFFGDRVALETDTSDLRSIRPDRQQSWLEQALVGEVALALRVEPSEIDPFQPLQSFGLDSLMAVQLRNRIEAAFGVEPLQASDLLGDTSLAGLASRILAEIRSSPNTVNATRVAKIKDQISQLSDDEVLALLKLEQGMPPGDSRRE